MTTQLRPTNEEAEALRNIVGVDLAEQYRQTRGTPDSIGRWIDRATYDRLHLMPFREKADHAARRTTDARTALLEQPWRGNNADRATARRMAAADLRYGAALLRNLAADLDRAAVILTMRAVDEELPR